MPNDNVFKLYWQFSAKRQQILYRRLSGLFPPWTNDPILKEYKFCNTFRATDKVSQYLIEHVAYGNSTTTAEDRVLRIIMFRFFSNIHTWETIENTCGTITVQSFDSVLYGHTLDQLKETGVSIYTGAFILCAHSTFGKLSKHRNHLALFQTLMHNDCKIIKLLLSATSLKNVYDSLIQLPLIGKFMAYQIAIDLNYGPDFNFQEDSFVAAGPGADRGIIKCFRSRGRWSNEDIIQWVQQNQVDLASYYGIDCPSLFGRPLQSIDCQGLFCETDKYCRVAIPEIASSRKRIKARYRTNNYPLPQLFLPPKWGLDASKPEDWVTT